MNLNFQLESDAMFILILQFANNETHQTDGKI